MNYDNKNLFFNKLWHGILIGFLLPMIIFVFYYLYRFGQYSFPEYLSFLFESKKFVGVLSISVLPNLAPFFLLVNTDRLSSGRGVLTATIIIGVAIFIIKLF